MIAERRAAGILLHISSLPNEYGIGTMGRAAYKFVDLLANNGIKYWQVLPLVQTDTEIPRISLLTADRAIRIL